MKTIWIKCTLQEGKKSIRVNMALAATFVDFKGGSKIWIPGDESGLDVIETPDQIEKAMKKAENA